MTIRWERIIAAILLGIFVYLLIKLEPMLRDIFQVVNEPFGYDSPIKAFMIGVLCLTLIAAIILLKK